MAIKSQKSKYFDMKVGGPNCDDINIVIVNRFYLLEDVGSCHNGRKYFQLFGAKYLQTVR